MLKLSEDNSRKLMKMLGTMLWKLMKCHRTSCRNPRTSCRNPRNCLVETHEFLIGASPGMTGIKWLTVARTRSPTRRGSGATPVQLTHAALPKYETVCFWSRFAIAIWFLNFKTTSWSECVPPHLCCISFYHEARSIRGRLAERLQKAPRAAFVIAIRPLTFGPVRRL